MSVDQVPSGMIVHRSDGSGNLISRDMRFAAVTAKPATALRRYRFQSKAPFFQT